MFARFNITSQLPRVTSTLKHMSDYTGSKEKCINTVQLMGRVGQEPSTIGRENQFVKFSLATSQEGSETTKTNWHNVVVFNPNVVDIVRKYVSKGSRIMVNGTIEYSNYENPDGVKMTSTSIITQDITLLSHK